MDVVALRRGFRDVIPLLLGVIPFALVVGVAAGNAGLDLELAVGMSVVVFAGASQLAALELLGSDAPILVVIVTAVIINLRMFMYSASIAPYFKDFAAKWKASLAYILTDQAYALSIARFETDEAVSRREYYIGAAVPLWIAWQIMTVVGVVVGASVPDEWGLNFAVPLVFLALLVPAVDDRPTMVAALVAGAVAVVGAGWPLNLGLPAGATVGILAGAAAERVMR